MTGMSATATQLTSTRSPQVSRQITHIATVASIGGLLFGYDTGVISGALVFMHQSMHLSSLMTGIIVTALLVGAAVGSSLGGKIADTIGRRTAISWSALVFAVGALVAAVAWAPWILVLARVILGLAVGIASAIVPMYISEVAPTEDRGRLVTQSSLLRAWGQGGVFATNALIAWLVPGESAWRFMFALGVIPAAALWFGMRRLPESHRWLLMKGREEEARKVLATIRDPHEIDPEIELTRCNIDKERAANLSDQGGWSDFSTPWMRTAILVAIGVAICNQASGINTVMYYAPTVLSDYVGLGERAALVNSVAVGGIAILAVYFGRSVVDRVPRRTLLLGGQIGTTLMLLALGTLFLVLGPVTESRSVSPVLAASIVVVMTIFVFINESSVSVATWLLLSELLPQRIRGFATGLAVTVMWIFNCAISLFFPIITEAVGPRTTFYLFAAIGFLALTFTALCVPETKGRSLEDIEQYFRDRAARRARTAA